MVGLAIKKATDVFHTNHCGYVTLHFLLIFLWAAADRPGLNAARLFWGRNGTL